MNEQSVKSNSGFLTEAELQTKIPVCRRTISYWRKQGKLPFIKFGKRILFHWPTVEGALLRHQLNCN
jgi:hypothetical protein